MRFLFSRRFNPFDCAVIVIASEVAEFGHLLASVLIILAGATVSTIGELAMEARDAR